MLPKYLLLVLVLFVVVSTCIWSGEGTPACVCTPTSVGIPSCDRSPADCGILVGVLVVGGARVTTGNGGVMVIDFFFAEASQLERHGRLHHISFSLERSILIFVCMLQKLKLGRCSQK